MTIECVNISNNHLFLGNPLAGQHQLRYNSIIQRQDWKVSSYQQMEFDNYDNPATWYLVWRDENGIVRGSSRLYPTNRPYMLKEFFSNLAGKHELPCSEKVWEGTRFCVDKNASPELRKRIIQEIIIGYLEFGLDNDIENYIGIMLPLYWRNIFIKNGWDVDFWVEPIKIENGTKIQSGKVSVSNSILQTVRKKTGIYNRIISYGEETITKIAV
jgi:N-acyl-L-homoserine lactone synthetase